MKWKPGQSADDVDHPSTEVMSVCEIPLSVELPLQMAIVWSHVLDEFSGLGF